MGGAREMFLQTQINNKVKRFSEHCFGPSGRNKFYTGEIVYFKQIHSKKWKGPGTVIIQDNEQVLIKHKGYYVRLHPCRAMLEKISHNKRSSKQKFDDQSLNFNNSSDIYMPVKSNTYVECPSLSSLQAVQYCKSLNILCITPFWHLQT